MNTEIFIKETDFSKEFINFLVEFFEIKNYKIIKESKKILFLVEFKKPIELKDFLKLKTFFKKSNFPFFLLLFKKNFIKIFNKEQILEYLKYFFEKENIKKEFKIEFSEKLIIFSDFFEEFEKYKKKLFNFFESIGISFINIYFKNNKIKNDYDFEDEIKKRYKELIKKNSYKQKKTFDDKEFDVEKIVQGKILKVDTSIYNNKKTTKILIDTIDSAIIAFLHKNTYKSSNINEIKENNWFRFLVKNIKYKSKDYKNILFFQKIDPIFDREDKSIEKRIELHVHTKMSALDGIGNLEDYIKTAIHFGHEAIAFTDHENIHIFPELIKFAKKYKEIKIIFGCEFNFLSEDSIILTKNINKPLFSETFVFFDLETTGLSSYYDEIIEFAAVISKNGIILKKESFFIKTEKKISDSIIKLTNINYEEYLKKSITKEEAVIKIKQIFSNYVLVAHNVNFDIPFINKIFKENKMCEVQNAVFDTLMFSYYLNVNLKSHRLEKLARFYDINFFSKKAHRALYDANILCFVFFKMFNDNKHIELKDVFSLNNHINIKKRMFPNHINVLVKNEKGIKNIYNLISISHTKTLYKRAILEKDDLQKFREGLLVGAGCYNSEVFNAALSKKEEELEKIIEYYDYIEIQPLEIYSNLIYKERVTEKNLKDILIRIIKISKKLNKIIIASGDVHFIEPRDKFYRDIFIFTKQLKGSFHHLNDKRIVETPNQYFRTTDEMLKSFDFLNNENFKKEIVIENPKKISDLINKEIKFKDELFLPKIQNSDEILKKLSLTKLKEKYGQKPDEEILKRFDNELNKIIKQNFSTIYLLAYELANFSLKEGYLVGSRGSVGSSFLAYCLDITEVNPLKPHYLCSNCYYFEWSKNKDIGSGFDLIKKKCINCNKKLNGNGQKISFESFLGIDGKSVPDIDLNFSGKFQETAIKFIVDLIDKKIGKSKIFRAGTISTVAERTAFAYLMEYLEKKDIIDKYNFFEKMKIVNYCIGVKKTTGQHPGGFIIVPSENNILDFTPLNFPSNDESKSLTTHFDYHVLKNKLLKLDVLGHDDPTALKILLKLTKIDIKEIKFDDIKVIELFSDINVLNIKSKDLFGEKTGVVGLPEFGTMFVRRILKTKKVLSFSDLISVSGLSHGTNVWESNAKDLLINNKKWTFKNVIACRDDIMQMLIEWGFSINDAYKYMQIVKKGKGLSLIQENDLKQKKIPLWFIESCKKISYMFPKAHATAYVIMAYRFAWFKIYYPIEFYATYFSIRIDVFDLETILSGESEIEKKYRELNILNNMKNKKITVKQKKILTILEVAKEMMARGFKLELLDLMKSKISEFLIINEDGKKKIIPPLTSIDGLGIEAAKRIINEREKTPFKSSIDFRNRTKINKTVFQILERIKVLDKINKFKQKNFKF